MRAPLTKYHLKCHIKKKKKKLLAGEQLQKSQCSYSMDCSRTIMNVLEPYVLEKEESYVRLGGVFSITHNLL